MKKLKAGKQLIAIARAAAKQPPKKARTPKHNVRGSGRGTKEEARKAQILKRKRPQGSEIEVEAARRKARKLAQYPQHLSNN